MAGLATEHAELFLDALLALFLSQFSILPKMGGGVWSGRLRSAGGAGRALVPVVRALALVILLLGLGLGVGRACRALGAGGGRRRRVPGLAQDFRLVFPVPGIDGLRKGAKAIEGVGLSNTGDLIFDVVGKTTVEDVAECAIAIATDLSGEAIELYDVLIDLLSFLHGQVVQLMFCVPNRIMRTKVGLQFGDKLSIQMGQELGLEILSRSGSNHSRAMPLR